MIDYSNINPSEWINNALESYHRRLQNKLTKYIGFIFFNFVIRNPTINEFVTRLQIEEKYFMNKYWEAFKYPVNQKKQETLKRKIEYISKTPIKSTSTNIKQTNSPFVPLSKFIKL